MTIELTPQEIQRLLEVSNYFINNSDQRFYHDTDAEIKALQIKLKNLL